FLTEFDTIPQVSENNAFKYLSSRYCAHKLPDQVLFWLNELQNAIANLYIIFKKELVEAQSMLCNYKFMSLINNLKLGLEKAQEGFVKWMDCWTHLLLTVCLLDGSNGPDVFLNHPLNVEITDIY
ncbi:28902_t:CDS:1, partial [Dentiscutata erythropus]